MVRRTTRAAVLTVLFIGGLTATAADADKPVGKWERSAGETKILFDIKADGMKVALTDNSGNSIKIDATYTVKDGVLSGEVKKIERAGIDGGPSEGDKFGFRIKVDKDKLTISDVTGTDSDEAKALVQGEYKKAE